jgi:hypothetical protein
MSAMKHFETASIAQNDSTSESLRSRSGLDSAVLSGTGIKVKTNKKLMTISQNALNLTRIRANKSLSLSSCLEKASGWDRAAKGFNSHKAKCPVCQKESEIKVSINGKWWFCSWCECHFEESPK